MKKVSLLLLISIIGFTAINAQSFKLTSAWSELTEYITLKAEEDDKRLEHIAEARKLINEATSHDKTSLDPKAWYYKGKILSAMATEPTLLLAEKGLATEASDAFKKTVDLDTKGKWKSKVVDDLGVLGTLGYNTGVELYGKKQYGLAYQIFKSVVANNEYLRTLDDKVELDQAAYLSAAYAADQSGEKEDAVGFYQKLVDLGTDKPSVYQSLSTILMDMDKADDALAVITKGKEILPDNSDLAIAELNYYLSTGKTAEVTGKLEKAIAADPSNPQLYLALGSTYDQLKDLTKAEKAYKDGIAAAPEDLSLNYNLGALYYNQAVEKATQMNDLDINDTANYNRLKGEKDGLISKALPFFSKAESVDGSDLGTLMALKEIYAQMDDLTKSNEYKAKIEKLK